MIFLADESLEFPLVSGLRERGMDCRAILEEYPSIPDDEVLKKSLSLDAILLTEDKDFGELVVRFNMQHCGVLLLRLEDDMEMEEKLNLLYSTLIEFSDKIKGSFAVLSEDRLRIRET